MSTFASFSKLGETIKSKLAKPCPGPGRPPLACTSPAVRWRASPWQLRPVQVRSGQLLKGCNLAREGNITFTGVYRGMRGFAWLAFFQFSKIGLHRPDAYRLKGSELNSDPSVLIRINLHLEVISVRRVRSA